MFAECPIRMYITLACEKLVTDEDAYRNENNPRTEPPSFGELDASRGMLALSHQNLTDLTPRNLYEARNPRTSTEGYGFPSSHSLNSSVSAPSHRDSYPYYSASVASTDSSSDYSSAASDGGYDSMPASRTLPAQVN